MKLASYLQDGQARVGVVKDDGIVDSGFGGTMIALIADWPQLREVVVRHVEKGTSRPLADVRLCAPVLRPGKIFALGLNYSDHMEESGLKAPERQVWFTKAQTSVNGPFEPILIARNAPLVDYEVELVAVIGRGGKHISADAAAEHVFGYCVGNDVTERLWQTATPQWSLGKSFDTHAPLGPWITTADEIENPHDLGLRCFVNGELRQSSNTKHMIYNLWQQIEHLSSAMTLEPGDVIFTGTPAGIGATRKPAVFLKAGDVVRCEIDQLGAIEGVMQDEV